MVSKLTGNARARTSLAVSRCLAGPGHRNAIITRVHGKKVETAGSRTETRPSQGERPRVWERRRAGPGGHLGQGDGIPMRDRYNWEQRVEPSEVGQVDSPTGGGGGGGGEGRTGGVWGRIRHESRSIPQVVDELHRISADRAGCGRNANGPQQLLGKDDDRTGTRKGWRTCRQVIGVLGNGDPGGSAPASPAAEWRAIGKMVPEKSRQQAGRFYRGFPCRLIDAALASASHRGPRGVRNRRAPAQPDKKRTERSPGHSTHTSSSGLRHNLIGYSGRRTGIRKE